MLWNSPLMERLRKNLDVTALQQKVTANNLANLNTPDYKKLYLSFKEKQNQKGAGMALSSTNNKHYLSTEAHGKPEVRRERQTTRRPDGNNVDLDQEMLDMVTNQLRYNTLVQQVSERYAQWTYIINEGRR